MTFGDLIILSFLLKDEAEIYCSYRKRNFSYEYALSRAGAEDMPFSTRILTFGGVGLVFSVISCGVALIPMAIILLIHSAFRWITLPDH